MWVRPRVPRAVTWHHAPGRPWRRPARSAPLAPLSFRQYATLTDVPRSLTSHARCPATLLLTCHACFVALQAVSGQNATEALAASLDPRGASERQLLSKLLYIGA